MATSVNSSTPKIVGALVMSAVIAVGTAVFIVKPNIKDESSNKNIPTKSSQAQSSTSSTPTNSTTSTNPVASSNPTTANGQTYTEKMRYIVPKGGNTIEVTVGVKDGVITTVSDKHVYGGRDSESQYYTESFDSEVSSVVVGKKVSNISSTRIAGASLTSQAFYDALLQISNRVNG